MEKEKVAINLPSGEQGSDLDEKQLQLNDPCAKCKFESLPGLVVLAMLKSITITSPHKQFEDSFQRRHDEDYKDKKDHENILFTLGYLIFIAAPLAFPATRNATGGLRSILCYHIAFEELRRCQKLEKLWSLMVRVGDYFRGNLSQASTNNNQEQKSQEGSYMRLIFDCLYWAAAEGGEFISSGEAYKSVDDDCNGFYYRDI